MRPPTKHANQTVLWKNNVAPSDDMLGRTVYVASCLYELCWYSGYPAPFGVSHISLALPAGVPRFLGENLTRFTAPSRLASLLGLCFT